MVRCAYDRRSGQGLAVKNPPPKGRGRGGGGEKRGGAAKETRGRGGRGGESKGGETSTGILCRCENCKDNMTRCRLEFEEMTAADWNLRK